MSAVLKQFVAALLVGFAKKVWNEIEVVLLRTIKRSVEMVCTAFLEWLGDLLGRPRALGGTLAFV